MDMKAVVTRALEIRKEAKRIIDAIENGDSTTALRALNVIQITFNLLNHIWNKESVHV